MKNRNDEKRLRIAEEKRRWTIRHYSKNGKPDKLRRPGRPWDKSILDKAAEKITYSSGSGVDLTALDSGNIDSIKSGTAGSKETISKALAQVALQNYLNEVAKYEQLMNPLNKIMEKTIQNSGDRRSGYGPIGPTLYEAALNNGIVPPPTPPRQARPLTSEFKNIIDENTLRGTTYCESNGQNVIIEDQKKTSPSRFLDETSTISSLGDRNPGDGDVVIFNKPTSQPSKKRKPTSLFSHSPVGSQSSRSYIPANSLNVEGNASQAEPTPTRQRWNRRNAPDDAESILGLRQKTYTGESDFSSRNKRSSIPWHLLDQLDGEKKKFEAERNYILETKKF